MGPADFEHHLTWELQSLPTPRAPQTLLPRVMAAVQAWALRPWYERAWFTWPLGWQLATVAVLVLAAVAGVLLAPSADAVRNLMATAVSSRVATVVPDLGDRIQAMSLAARVVWRALIHPVLVYTLVIVTLMSVACAAVAVALNRAVFGKAFE